MKLLSIICAIVLGLSTFVQAQDKATDPNEPSKRITPAGKLRNVPDPAVNIGTDANGSIHIELNGGRLIDAIAEIESHISGGGAVQPMPNLIYSGEDVPDLAMSGKSRMAGVTPVQAVALACAAAGCTLEPIFAPAEGVSSLEAVQKVIGYRIGASASGADFLVSRTPTATVTELGGGVGSKGGGVGTFAPVTQSSFGGRRDSLVTSPQAATSADADTTERVVRVYALGSLLARSGENGSVETDESQKRRLELIRATEELIGQTLAQAELTAAKSPDLAFNGSLRVLVAKATAAQHEIISQIIQALKENEPVPAQANMVVPIAEPTIPTPAPAEKPKSNP